ncbi:MerR family transcriptional regulator, partial [Streptomyces sp. SID4985]|uniref:MerR family transcriptional regulator n=1 Tax=Streptomyces sp. SID4985 TaxID=2690292 RepID=UPI00136DEC00
MSPEGLLSIGELAERAGVTVKTVRFYSDLGLLPEASRSSGGHRRYGPGALDRLRLIRSLRALDLPVPEVGRVLDEGDGPAGTTGVLATGALENALDGRLRELGSEITALRWREAALQLVRDCPAEERADRIRLVGAVSAPPSTAALARFWRGALPARLSPRLRSAILDHAVPRPPADPTP